VGVLKDKHILMYDNSTKGWAWNGWVPGTCCIMERVGVRELLFHGKGGRVGLVVSFMERAGVPDSLFLGKGGRLGLVLWSNLYDSTSPTVLEVSS
jgi:hypothetical protein